MMNIGNFLGNDRPLIFCQQTSACVNGYPMSCTGYGFIASILIWVRHDLRIYKSIHVKDKRYVRLHIST